MRETRWVVESKREGEGDNTIWKNERERGWEVDSEREIGWMRDLEV